MATDVLFDALQGLASSPASPDLDAFLQEPSPGLGFNHSLMIFLPKAPSGIDEQLGEYFDPGDTRPLKG